MVADMAIAQSNIIKVGYDPAVNSVHIHLIDQLKQFIDKNLNNKVSLKLYPYTTKFKERDALAAIKEGRLDIAMPSISSVVDYAPRLKLFELPFLFANEEAAEKFVNGEYGQRMAGLVASGGVYGYGFLSDGMKQFVANKKITQPFDVLGVKMGITNSDVLIQQYDQMGAVSTPVKRKDIKNWYSASKINAYEENWAHINTNNIKTAASYITESDHAYKGFLLVMSENFWNLQNAKNNDIYKSLLSESLAAANRIHKQKITQSKLQISAADNVEIYRLSVNERQSWSAALQLVWEIFEDDIGKELINIAASIR